MIDRSERGRLRYFPDLTGGRVLALRKSVDLVVEHQNCDVDVAPEGMN